MDWRTSDVALLVLGFKVGEIFDISNFGCVWIVLSSNLGEMILLWGIGELGEFTGGWGGGGSFGGIVWCDDFGLNLFSDCFNVDPFSP